MNRSLVFACVISLVFFACGRSESSLDTTPAIRSGDDFVKVPEQTAVIKRFDVCQSVDYRERMCTGAVDQITSDVKSIYIIMDLVDVKARDRAIMTVTKMTDDGREQVTISKTPGIPSDTLVPIIAQITAPKGGYTQGEYELIVSFQPDANYLPARTHRFSVID